ncbi:hypothetical protein PR048_014444 [Dryococelus australis]|uniref:Uncharacterized protein n=1 Tax=Dryococelus australis TaxID=614101 RepID=A0ABQ9HE86_9NEOP|nr:hypothetical protein PR048_014444 [Dryococelus australis]
MLSSRPTTCQQCAFTVPVIHVIIIRTPVFVFNMSAPVSRSVSLADHTFPTSKLVTLTPIHQWYGPVQYYLSAVSTYSASNPRDHYTDTCIRVQHVCSRVSFRWPRGPHIPNLKTVPVIHVIIIRTPVFVFNMSAPVSRFAGLADHTFPTSKLVTLTPIRRWYGPVQYYLSAVCTYCTYSASNPRDHHTDTCIRVQHVCSRVSFRWPRGPHIPNPKAFRDAAAIPSFIFTLEHSRWWQRVPQLAAARRPRELANRAENLYRGESLCLTLFLKQGVRERSSNNDQGGWEGWPVEAEARPHFGALFSRHMINDVEGKVSPFLGSACQTPRSAGKLNEKRKKNKNSAQPLKSEETHKSRKSRDTSLVALVRRSTSHPRSPSVLFANIPVFVRHSLHFTTWQSHTADPEDTVVFIVQARWAIGEKKGGGSDDSPVQLSIVTPAGQAGFTSLGHYSLSAGVDGSLVRDLGHPDSSQLVLWRQGEANPLPPPNPSKLLNAAEQTLLYRVPRVTPGSCFHSCVLLSFSLPVRDKEECVNGRFFVPNRPENFGPPARRRILDWCAWGGDVGHGESPPTSSRHSSRKTQIRRRPSRRAIIDVKTKFWEGVLFAAPRPSISAPLSAGDGGVGRGDCGGKGLPPWRDDGCLGKEPAERWRRKTRLVDTGTLNCGAGQPSLVDHPQPSVVPVDSGCRFPRRAAVDRHIHGSGAATSAVPRVVEHLQNVTHVRSTVSELLRRATVAERLACSLPTKAIRVQSRPGHSGFLHVGIVPDDAVGRRVFSGIYLSFPPPWHSGAAPYSPRSPSSALKTSMLKRLRLEHCAPVHSLALRGDGVLDGVEVLPLTLPRASVSNGEKKRLPAAILRVLDFETHIKASERVNVDVFTQNKRPCPQHSPAPFLFVLKVLGELLSSGPRLGHKWLANCWLTYDRPEALSPWATAATHGPLMVQACVGRSWLCRIGPLIDRSCFTTCKLLELRPGCGQPHTTFKRHHAGHVNLPVHYGGRLVETECWGCSCTSIFTQVRHLTFATRGTSNMVYKDAVHTIDTADTRNSCNTTSQKDRENSCFVCLRCKVAEEDSVAGKKEKMEDMFAFYPPSLVKIFLHRRRRSTPLELTVVAEGTRVAEGWWCTPYRHGESPKCKQFRQTNFNSRMIMYVRGHRRLAAELGYVHALSFRFPRGHLVQHIGCYLASESYQLAGCLGRPLRIHMTARRFRSAVKVMNDLRIRVTKRQASTHGTGNTYEGTQHTSGRQCLWFKVSPLRSAPVAF